ncbi:DUF5134 domain-containing protein [Arthrobacter sp. EpRS71]|uniref:DUF5134 domain-containing protein n=1 Tax=Arthrobacter sp. EpRS71 TaxID=1743141 RepID=UPI000746A36A|nr:DUF5134 domain-containing protein [Arthrobacter sp. EpRS71]KUM34338.1 hypothetical protein AR689_09250 [Arthrobacter sp. EpRS71]
MLAPFLSIPVSLFLAAGTIFCLTKALTGRAGLPRWNYGVHALMALGMLGMVWHGVDLPLLPQVLLFGVASFWFLLQAVSRAEFSLLCHTRSGRIRCFYHAAMLAAMVFMLLLPHAAAVQDTSSVAAGQTASGPHAGHALTPAAASGSAFNVLWMQPAAQLLAIVFAVAVLIWLLPVRRIAAGLRGGRAPGMRTVSRPLPIILERSYEAGAALTMSLMFAAASM